jgi:hypothetical protein
VVAFGAELLGWTPDSVGLVEHLRGWTETAILDLELGWDAERRRVVIPIRDEQLEEVGELRYDPTGEHHPKMLATSGSPRVLTPPPESIALDTLDQLRTVWLVEGEPDMIRLRSLGLVAIAVPGAGNWRDEWAARFTGQRWRVIVCFDCDTAGRDGARRAAAAIVNAGGDARLLDLDGTRDDGFDLTDFARTADTADLRDQAAAALTTIADHLDLHQPEPDKNTSTDFPAERPWRSQTWSTFRDTSPTEHTWLIDGLLPAGVLCFVAGPPKRGKTWVGIGTALALALGRPYAGQFEVPDPRDVLYVALEGSATGLRTRIGALARGYGGDPDTDDLDRLHMLYRPRPFDLAEIATADWLVAEAVDVDAAFVIVDVLRAAARFDENAAADFARIRDRLDPLLTAGRTVALLHHFGKLTDTQKERSPGERMAGTGAMYGALDVGLLITRSEDGARRLGVVVEARDFAAPDALALAIVGDGTGRHGGFTYADTATLAIDETADEQRDLVALAEELLAGDGDWLLARELSAAPDKGGVGANIDGLRDALEPACTPPAPGAPSRLVRLAKGSGVGRAATAQPYGTWAMYEALPEPRPDRLYALEPVGAGQLNLGPEPAAPATGSIPTGYSRVEPVADPPAPGVGAGQ